MSLTGGAPLCRIAAFGDSLTQGDGWPGPVVPLRKGSSSDSWLFPDCRMRFGRCRGNYPRLLQGLLGAEAIVRNFGASGRSMSDLVPQACHPCADSLVNATLDTIIVEHHRKHHLRNQLTCESQLLHTPTFVELAAFAPHVVVLQFGTNDAIHSKFTSCYGTLGFAHSMASTILGLWQLTAHVLYLEPPPTMSDNVYAAPRGGAPACVRMHNCRYHPTLSCWSLAECITCSAADRLDSDRSINHPDQFNQPHAEATCVRHDALQQIRRAGSQITAQIVSFSEPERSPAHKQTHAGAPDGPAPGRLGNVPSARCGSNSAKPELRWVTTSSLQPSWRYFSGPYHLSPAGSAFLACTVHNALASSKSCAQCERQQAGAAHGDQARASWAQFHNVSIGLAPPLHNAVVARKFCDAILAGAQGAALLTSTTLDALEAGLFERRTSARAHSV